MLAGIRTRVARWIAPVGGRPRTAQRLYGGARNTKTTGWFGAGTSSADAELNSSLASLRSRSRQMVRDSGYAKRAKACIVNNVIGTGVGLQAQVLGTRGELNTRVNDDIERAWAQWCRPDACHTGGALHFSDLERALLGEVVEAGEVFLRLHFRPFGSSKVPLALELIEAERLADSLAEPGPRDAGNEVRMGVDYRRITIRDQRSRWGSCSASGELSYSWRLILAPDYVLDYVAAHEVAHLRHLDHSQRFWRLVLTHCQGAAKAKNWLRAHGQDVHRVVT